MHFSLRRILFSFLLVLLFLGAGSSLRAYPVSITINVTFVEIPGQSDPLGLGTASPPITGIITTTIDSSLPMASYPATVDLTIPAIGLTNSVQSGSLSIATNGLITATFSAPASGSFSAMLALQGVTFPNPVPSSFGNASFSSPASSVHYTLLGQTGVVGVTGTISAVGLTATPASISSSYTVGGTAPAPQTVTVGSNSGAALSYTAAITGASAPFLTIMPTSGTTPGAVVATFSTSVAPGTYSATIDVNTSPAQGAPISIPVTYTVSSSGGGGGNPSLQVAPGSLSYQFFLPGSTTSASQSITVTSSTGATSFTASVQSGSFLSVSPTSGNIPGSVTVTANATSLSAGTFFGSILLSAPSVQPVSVPVTVTVTQGSGANGFAITPSTLHFTYMIGQPPPPPQTLTVSNPVPISFTATSPTFYLPVSPASAITTAAVSVSLSPAASLAPGSYTYDLSFRTAAGLVASVPVVLTVEGGLLSLTAAPSSLSFSNASGSPLTQTLSITSAVAASYTATTTTPWLAVTPAMGATPGNVMVTANSSGLAAGSYTGSIVLTSATSGVASLTIPVTFSVAQAAPISVSPAGLAFAYQLGGAAPAAQAVTITNPTGTTVTAVGASWLTVSVSADLTTATASVNTANLAAGIYTGSLVISAPGAVPIAVPVTLTVSASGAGIGLSSSALTFNYQPNGTPPAAQVVSIAAPTATTLTVTSDSAWLTVSSSSVTVPGTLSVMATPGTMAAGVYAGNLTLTSASGAITLPVTLNIGQTAAPVIAAISNAISYENSIGAPGLFAAVWGTGLGAVGASGTQVFADGIPCPVLFASPGQVNIILPFSLAGQTSASIQLFFNGVASNSVSIAIQSVAPSIFTSNASGSGGGAILNPDLTVNSAANPAPAGGIVAIYAGGGGETTPLGIDGMVTSTVAPFPAPVLLPATVTIGGQNAPLDYYGAAPDLLSGILQINATIPAGTASGPQPIVFSVNGVTSQPNVVVYVQ